MPPCCPEEMAGQCMLNASVERISLSASGSNHEANLPDALNIFQFMPTSTKAMPSTSNSSASFQVSYIFLLRTDADASPFTWQYIHRNTPCGLGDGIEPIRGT